MKKKLFITGATGFIGDNLIKKLLLSDNTIFALSRKMVAYPDKKITVIQGDILKPESFSSFVKGCDVIFHCAGYISFHKKDFQKACRVNVEGTANVLKVAHQHKVKKVIHLSACAVLGISSDKNKILDETANPEIEQDNIYAYTKKLAEDVVKTYVQKGLDVSIANIATVYGRGDKGMNSGNIIKTIYEGKMRMIPPGGTSFVSVKDLVTGLILLAEKGKTGERYILCTENIEYKKLIRRISETLKVRCPKYILPMFTYYPALVIIKALELFSKNNFFTAQLLREAYGYKYFTAEKSKKELGWTPSQSFKEAAEEAFNYYKEESLI